MQNIGTSNFFFWFFSGHKWQHKQRKNTNALINKHDEYPVGIVSTLEYSQHFAGKHYTFKNVALLPFYRPL